MSFEIPLTEGSQDILLRRYDGGSHALRGDLPLSLSLHLSLSLSAQET